MDPGRWDNLEELVEQTLALPLEERDRYLAEACGSDYELRSEIESLLKFSDQASGFTLDFSEKVMIPAFNDFRKKQEKTGSLDKVSLANKVIGHYRIIQKIGSGGMGVVYKARDLRLGRFVAVKLLPPNLSSNPRAKQRFISEAKAVSALDHPNICTLYEISETDADRLFMIMAWYKGQTLKTWIKKGALPARQGLHYARQIADGLACAHKAGFTHRDVKPANIMITDDEAVKILDFGIVKKLQSDLPGENTVIGSLPYMSPEQVRGEEVDHRSDIWALGVVLYEMLTGKRPFDGETDTAVLHAILQNESTPARVVQKEVPAALEEIVNKCLIKDPNLRYQHIDEVLADLKRADREAASGKARKFSMFVIPVFLVLAMAAQFLRSETAPVSDVQRSIAVLPFENLSPDPEDAYFADGVHEAIISSLSGIGALTVIARSSMLDYSPEERNLIQIGRELGISLFMEGTVRRSGDRIRVSVNLVDVEHQTMIWSNTYEDHLHDVFGIQNRIAREVAGELQATLTTSEQQRLEEQPTDNLQAYHFYMQGREYLSRSKHQSENPMAAKQLFRRALYEDPYFAHAWGLLAVAYSDLYWFHGHTRERLEQMREAAEQAQRLAPDLAETMHALGLYHYWSDPDNVRTLSFFESALLQFPNHPILHQFTALTHRRLGNWDQVEKHFIRAIELDPRNSNYYSELSFFYYLLREYDKAITVANRLLEMSPDASAVSRGLNALYILERDGSLDGFNTWRELIHPLDPAEVAPLWWGYFYSYWNRDWDNALWSFNNIKTELAWESDGRYILRDYLIAILYDNKGDRSAAIEYYKHARLHLEALCEEFPGDSRYRIAVGKVYARLGEPELAVREGKLAIRLLTINKNAIEGAWFERELAYIYTWSGLYEEAINKLELLLAIPSNLHKNELRISPDWDPLRGHPRFQALIAVEDEPMISN